MSQALQPERWKQLKPLLDQALDLDPVERLALLDELGRNSPSLRADLERLLSLHDHTTGLQESAAVMAGGRLIAGDSAGPSTQPRLLNKRIGPYALRRLIGYGGMGTVYEGERVEGGFRQQVAIKLISGMHPGLHQRFLRERQILAELKHPNIPQLFDGGATDDGMPFLVQEYVEGQTLMEFANALNADLDLRLSLLLQVAEALGYAHRRKVLHRDIKPGNILVTKDGAVKLLDFGIAKLLEATDQPTLTQQQIGPMTPDYAAPEQFLGGAVGVATDIYQFGVLAFHLLAGRSPYRTCSSDSRAFFQAVCDDAPLSLLAALQNVSTSPPSHTATAERPQRQRLADLDRILQHCLDKQPAQRYPDMQALIADLEAVRSNSVPAETRRRGRQRLWHLGVTASALVIALALTLLLPLPRVWQDPWSEDPALHAMGLGQAHVYAERDDTEALLIRAMQAEARGDLPDALALLESLHTADSRTPVPALLLGYWSPPSTRGRSRSEWQQLARQRIEPLEDPVLELVLRFIENDGTANYEDTLRFAAAVLEMKPEAWFMRLARAHLLSARGLPVAALKELQDIRATRLGHRKLVDAIADRASLGDLAGARALAAGLDVADDNPMRTLLEARLAYTGGDLIAARDLYAQSVIHARAVGRLEIEARGLLFHGLLEGALGRYDTAAAPLRAARERLASRGQIHQAVDASLALAQIAALRGDAEAMQRELAATQRLRADQSPGRVDYAFELFLARLTRQVDDLRVDDGDTGWPLLAARQALIEGDANRANRLLDRAEERGAAESRLVEEYALLCDAVGRPKPVLAPIDPPFQPFMRFATRWALGAGASVVPH